LFYVVNVHPVFSIKVFVRRGRFTGSIFHWNVCIQLPYYTVS